MLSTRYSRPISFFPVVSSALHLHHHVEEVAHLAVYVVIRSMVQPSSAPGVGRRCLTPIHTRTSSLPRRTIASSTPGFLALPGTKRGRRPQPGICNTPICLIQSERVL